MSHGDLVFGKYEIQHRLAIGGMGEVFYAVQKGIPGFERPVILKSLLPDLAAQDGFIDQFLDEARVAATLNHPNVVSIYEVGLWNGTYFIAMEYIQGRNLAQLLRRTVEQQLVLPQAVAARIVADAALGLDHAHLAKATNGEPLHIVHRDISPQNIMVRDDGVTKVVDFGIARASNRATRTATGTLKGKLAYMPPEQMTGHERVTPAVDQYGLGVCFWEMLTLRRLFKAETDVQLMRMVVERAIPSPSSIRPDIDPVLDALVMRMVSREPRDRFASCGDVALALGEYLAANSKSGVEQPAAFLRRLGSEEPAVAKKRENFVISLNQDASGVEPLMTATGVLAPPATTPTMATGTRPRPQPVARRSRIGWYAALAVTLVGVGVVGWVTRTPAPAHEPVQTQSAPAEPEPVATTPSTPTAPAPVQIVRTLRVETTPAGAAVRLDGRPIGVSPVDAELQAGVHYLLVEKAGFERVEREVAADAASPIEVALRLTPFKTAPRDPSPSRSNEPGYLSLDTSPWTKVQIDGEPAGSTPLFKKRLAAGKHQLILENEGEAIRVSKVVDVEPGKTLKLSLPLR